MFNKTQPNVLFFKKYDSMFRKYKGEDRIPHTKTRLIITGRYKCDGRDFYFDDAPYLNRT